MKDDKKNDVRCWFKIYHIKNDKGNVIKSDEDIYSYKMWIDQFTTTDLSITHEFLNYLYKFVFENNTTIIE